MPMWCNSASALPTASRSNTRSTFITIIRAAASAAILLQELIDACAASGFRQMIGYIDADNAASLALHEKFGFVRVGSLPGVAYRFGKWCDTVMVQRSLAAGATQPPSPVSIFR